jgi:hypothetical protein
MATRVDVFGLFRVSLRFDRFFGGVCGMCGDVTSTFAAMLQHLEVYHTRHAVVPNTLLKKAVQLIVPVVDSTLFVVDGAALTTELAVHPLGTTTLDIRCIVSGALDRALYRTRVRRIEAAALRSEDALRRVFRVGTLAKAPYNPDVAPSGAALAVEKYLDHEHADVLMAASRRAAIRAIEERRKWLLRPSSPLVRFVVAADISRRLEVIQDFVTKVIYKLREDTMEWAKPVALVAPVIGPVDETQYLLPVEVAIGVMIEMERNI